MKKQAAIASLYFNSSNFGGLLQCYALSTELAELEIKAEHLIFNNSIVPQGKKPTAKEKLRQLLCAKASVRRIFDRLYYGGKTKDKRNFKCFRRFEREIPHSSYLGSQKKIEEAGLRYDIFITGSDQVWNPVILSGGGEFVYGLRFASPERRKISYAASIGAEKAAVGKEELFREILAGLDFISVREKSAQAFLQPLTDKPVTVVLDPTMLLTRQVWDELAIGPGREPAHLFAYFLAEPDNRHDRQLHAVAETLGLPVRCIADEPGVYPRPDSGDSQRWDAGPKEFVGEIRDAEMVLTNSFHGIVFSVLFQKPFWVFKRNRDSETGSMNARVTDFLADFGLEDRLLEDGEIPSGEKLARPIDYEVVGRSLEARRAFSLSWLRRALEGI